MWQAFDKAIGYTRTFFAIVGMLATPILIWLYQAGFFKNLFG